MDTLAILVAEDNEHDFKKIKRAFNKSKIQVDLTRCIRAEEVLEVLESDERSFDLLLTDFMMPGMNGLELSQRLLDKGCQFPIILLTGEGDEMIAVNALKMGVSDYLCKDNDSAFIDLLVESVTKAINAFKNKLALKNEQKKKCQIIICIAAK